MKKLKGLGELIILAVLFGGVYYFFGDKIKDHFSEENRTKPYIDFYGQGDYHRGTEVMIQRLHAANIPYKYFHVESDSDKKKLAKKLEKAGLDSKNYTLPIMNVNGNFFINPNPSKVIADYKSEDNSRHYAKQVTTQ